MPRQDRATEKPSSRRNLLRLSRTIWNCGIKTCSRFLTPSSVTSSSFPKTVLRPQEGSTAVDLSCLSPFCQRRGARQRLPAIDFPLCTRLRLGLRAHGARLAEMDWPPSGEPGPEQEWVLCARASGDGPQDHFPQYELLVSLTHARARSLLSAEVLCRLMHTPRNRYKQNCQHSLLSLPFS